MKKKIIVSCALVISSLAFSQVGINTSNPISTLDVTAKNPTGTTTNVDGLLVPRVDRQRAQSMAGTPVSTLIYVNSIATGTAAGTAINIDEIGYYYFDGTAWTKLKTPTGGLSTNIYNADGTLSGNRTVTQGTNTLAFNSTAVNGFSVDGSTFSVDAAGNQVGIGTTTPGEKVDVKGAITYTGQAVANKTGAASIDYAASTVPAQARILSWGPDAATSGIISFWTGLGGAVANEKMRIHSNGNVGIGTTTPQKLLHVNGALQVTNELNVGGNATAAGSAGTTGQVLTSNGAGTAPSWQNASAASTNIYNADGALTTNRIVTQNANTLAFTGTSTNAFSVDGTTFSVDAANNRVGINKNNPLRSLDVNAGAAPIRITGLQTVNNSANVLAIDASGDIRSISFNNLNAGTLSSLTHINTNYTASGNETIIWNSAGSVTLTLPVPTAGQVGKTIYIIGAGGTVNLAGERPTTTNGTVITSIPGGNRITIFGIAAGVFGNPTNSWVVIAKDF